MSPKKYKMKLVIFQRDKNYFLFTKEGLIEINQF